MNLYVQILIKSFGENIKLDFANIIDENIIN
jgi:hypothetical protein